MVIFKYIQIYIYIYIYIYIGKPGQYGRVNVSLFIAPTFCALYGNSLLCIGQTHQNTTGHGIGGFYIFFFINTDYPVLSAKLLLYPHIRVNGILIRGIWDACLIVSFAYVTWSYIFGIVILRN